MVLVSNHLGISTPEIQFWGNDPIRLRFFKDVAPKKAAPIDIHGGLPGCISVIPEVSILKRPGESF